MPFITRVGNLRITDDVSGYRYNAATKENDYIIKEFDHELVLTNVGQYSFTKGTQDYLETVYDGDPDPKGMYFKGNVWFRVNNKNFEEIDYWRFYKKFRGQLIGEDQKKYKDMSQTVYYVPGYEDFQVNEYGKYKGFHFPVWFLDIIIMDKLPERGLTLNKDDEPTTKYIKTEEYEEMREIYEFRKAKEDFSISDDIKNALEEHAAMLNKEKSRTRIQGAVKAEAAKRFSKEIAREQAQAESKLLEDIKQDLKANEVETIDEIAEAVGSDISEIKKELAKSGNKSKIKA